MGIVRGVGNCPGNVNTCRSARVENHNKSIVFKIRIKNTYPLLMVSGTVVYEVDNV